MDLRSLLNIDFVFDETVFVCRLQHNTNKMRKQCDNAKTFYNTMTTMIPQWELSRITLLLVLTLSFIHNTILTLA